jgi:hypothetical protein
MYIRFWLYHIPFFDYKQPRQHYNNKSPHHFKRRRRSTMDQSFFQPEPVLCGIARCQLTSWSTSNNLFLNGESESVFLMEFQATPFRRIHLFVDLIRRESDWCIAPIGFIRLRISHGEEAPSNLFSYCSGCTTGSLQPSNFRFASRTTWPFILRFMERVERVPEEGWAT